MRTFNEILEAIRAGWIANFTLQEHYGLDPELTWNDQFSAVSLESAITYIVASAIYLHELVVGAKATELEEKIGTAYPFTKDWYKRQALLFQLGDAIAFNEATQSFTYPVTDTDKQIVKYVAVRERQVAGVTTLQVFATKADKTALSAPEFTALSSYLVQIGAAGTHFQFISRNPDQLEITLNVTYDPQVLNNLGEPLTDGIKTVNAAVDAYLNGIKYSGVYNRTRQVDAVQNASGVLDVVLGNVYMNTALMENQSFESLSGFFEAALITVNYTPGNKDDY